MPHFVEIHGLPDGVQRVRMNSGSVGVGSSANCEVSIDHPEVGDRALLIDVRGDSFWVQNLNVYPIYVGMEEVSPSAWSPCNIDEPVQLTQSISITLVKEADLSAAAVGDAEAGASGSHLDIGKLVQIGIIVCCLVGAIFILMAPKSDISSREIDNEFDFNQTISDLSIHQDDIEYDTVRRYLQQAWMADRRFGERDRTAVMNAYELLVNHRLIRENPDQNETLNEVYQYAARRLSSLRFDQ